MTSERDLDWRLASWLDDVATTGVPATLLARSLERVDVTRQRPGWLVRDRGRRPRAAGSRAARPIRLRAALAVAVAAVFVAIGAGLFVRLFPAIDVGPSGEPSIAPAPSGSVGPSASTGIQEAGTLLAYTRQVDRPNTDNRCYDSDLPTCPVPRVWIVGIDGTDAHELQPGGIRAQSNVFWSPDGTRLLYEEGGRLVVTGLAGGEPRVADTGCVAPCNLDFAFALSSDGAKLAFIRNGTDGSFVVATMDLATGRVSELSSTEGPIGGPRWSPDGRRIVFTVAGGKDNGGPDLPTLGAAMIVDADGQNLHQVTPSTLSANAADWSPDASRIVISASSRAGARDIYTVRPDGTDLLPLTSDGMSRAASWTPDGRILFARAVDGAEGAVQAFWTMNADGSNATVVLTAPQLGAAFVDFDREPAWQPTGGPAIVPQPWAPSPGTPVGPPEPTPEPTPRPDLSPGFSWTGSMTVRVDGFGGALATRLADGRVVIVHACDTTAELYDPASGTFTNTGSLAAGRTGETATVLQDGRVLVTGGFSCDDGDPAFWASAEIYDPATGAFTPVGSMGRPRQGHTATLLPDGRVLIAGGSTGVAAVALGHLQLASVRTVATQPEVLATAELFDPATGTFSPTGSMTTPRVNHTATALADGRVLLAGAGDEGWSTDSSAEVYDPATGSFQETGSMHSGRWGHTATLLQDDRVLVAGGKDGEGKSFDAAELYDPVTGKFNSAGSMHAGRQGHTATRLLDGRILIAGGFESNAQGWQVLSSVELFDPTTGVFTSIGSMGDARDSHTATLLLDGRVLIAGGSYADNSGGATLTSAVLYQT